MIYDDIWVDNNIIFIYINDRLNLNSLYYIILGFNIRLISIIIFNIFILNVLNLNFKYYIYIK